MCSIKLKQLSYVNVTCAPSKLLACELYIIIQSAKLLERIL